MKRHLLFVVVLCLTLPVAAQAVSPGTESFERTWARTDQPVADGSAGRTWMWGPDAFTVAFNEPYDDSPGDSRNVQYFDKARMEITHTEDDPSTVWYVTNGLLVTEMITGQLQLGDSKFEQRAPAAINVAGDAEDPDGVTYALLAGLLEVPPAADGAVLTATLAKQGGTPAAVVGDDSAKAVYGVTAAYHVQAGNIDHQVASPFWAFMNASGTVNEDGQNVDAQLFVNPFYATGYPVTEAYWSRVLIAGTPRDVLLQCFERRCLTYTPDNPPGWQVEAGNVGRHYYAWRYADAELQPAGQVRITRVFSDSPVADESSGEFIVLRNYSAYPVQLQGWSVTDYDRQQTYTFPDFALGPGLGVTLHTCSGAATDADLYTGVCAPWWDNDGDTAYLYDPDGNLMAQLHYN